ncbi:MAG: molybdopterin converting factor subunit 1 [Burkholderiaceae bacterium]
MSASIDVTLRLFAGLREATGVEQERLVLPPGTRVEQVRTQLADRGEAWSRGLRDAQRTRAAVNHQLVDERHELREGDELAFFPPVTGG